MTVERAIYGDDLIVADIWADEIGDWNGVTDATHLWVSAPPKPEITDALLADGFFFADRLMDVRVGLQGKTVDFAKHARMTPELTGACKDEMKAIAHESFPTDRRFHVSRAYDQALANRILDRWIDDVKEAYVCRHKGEVAGFLALDETDGNNPVVRLAAVAERFRPAGVALSMYAYVMETCKQKGFKSVRGQVSTTNTAALNLFFFLGAKAEQVRDIYIKETRG